MEYFLIFSELLAFWKAGAILGFFKLGGHGKSHVPQHKWDDIKRALDNSSLFL